MKKGVIGCLVFVLFFLIPIGATICRVMQDEDVRDAMDELEDLTLITDTYHFPMEYVTEYADGTVICEKYIESEDPLVYDDNPIRCIYYENDSQIGQADFVRDQFRNLTQVTTDDSVTEYALTYDEHNRVIQRVTMVDGVETETRTCRYDDQGNLVESIYYQNNAQLMRIVTDYNSQGHRTKISHYDASDQLAGYEVCDFNEESYNEIVQQYDADGNLLQYLEIAYSTYGKPILEKVFDASGSLLRTTARNIRSGEFQYPADQPNPFYDGWAAYPSELDIHP